MTECGLTAWQPTFRSFNVTTAKSPYETSFQQSAHKLLKYPNAKNILHETLNVHTMTTAPKKGKNVVIIGGGIIGCTTAYYLTHHRRFDPTRDTITLLEATKIAGGASGKAGGLLASWAYPTNIVGLSFDLHAQLADEHNGAVNWGYRRVKCGELTAVAREAPQEYSWTNPGILLGKWRNQKRAKPSVLPADLDWFSAEAATAYEEIADESSTAQVHPLQFTLAMAHLAEGKGAEIMLGMVTDINCIDAADSTAGGDVPVKARPLRECLASDRHQKVVSVAYADRETGETRSIDCDTIVLAAGPWTPTLLPGAPISSLRAHSVTIRPKVEKPISAYCLFTEVTLRDRKPPTIPKETTEDDDNEKNRNRSDTATAVPNNRSLFPEIYARPNGEVYICGRGDQDVPLPPTTDFVDVSSASINELLTTAASISDVLRDGKVALKRACYLPTVDVGGSGGPLIGETDIGGLVLAAGHSCWGILNAPATGKVVAELVMDGVVGCTDIAGLDPRKIL